MRQVLNLSDDEINAFIWHGVVSVKVKGRGYVYRRPKQ